MHPRAPLVLTLLLWALAVLGTGPARAAEGYGLSVVRSSADLVEVEPGQITTLGLRVVNRTDSSVEVDETFELPSGWRSAAPPATLRLEGGEDRTRLVGFSVPRGVTAGLYEVRYGVVGRFDPTLRDQATVRVLVHGVNGLSLVALQEPAPLVAGQSSEARLLVRNEGNTTIRVAFEASGDDRIETTVTPAEVVLQPAEAREVTLGASAARGLSHYERRALRVVARSVDGEARASAVVWIPILPVRAAKPDLARRLPLTASVHGTWGDGRPGVQAVLEGAGFVDAAEQVHLDLLARGPDMGGTGAFGIYDEYRATLATPWADVRVGDQLYGVSPLLSPGRYARGAEIVGRAGPVTASGFFGVARFDPRSAQELGGSLQFGVERGEAGVQLLYRRRRPSEDQVQTDLLASLRGTWRPWSWAELSAEVGAGRDDGGALHLGYRFEAAGRTPGGLAFEAAQTHAAPDFHGYYHDQDLTTAALVVPLATDVTAQASFLHRAERLDPGPSDPVAPRTTVGRASVRWRAGPMWTVSLGGDVADRRDAVATDAPTLDAGVRGTLGWAARHHSLYLEAVGVWQRARGGAPVLGTQATGNLAVHPLRRQSLGIYGSWSGPDLQSPLLAGGTAIGAFIDWEPVDGLVLDVRGERGLVARTVDQVDVSAVYRRPGHLEVGARVRWRSTKRDGSAALSAEAWVGVPLGMPVGRRKDVGSIRGNLVDAARLDRPGLPGVLVRVGDAVAVTDRRGRFALGPFPPGVHVLEVDALGMGLSRVSEVSLPLEVVVEGGRATRLELPVTDGASLGGRLALDGQGLGGVRVSVTDGRRTRARTTDVDGRFSFGGLPGGEWRIAVDTDGLPAWHRVDLPDAVHLEPGDARDLSLVAQPVDRPMALVDVGAVVLSPSPRPPPRRHPTAEPVATSPVLPAHRWVLEEPVPFDPWRVLPACFEAIGGVWILEPGGPISVETDLPVVPGWLLEDALGDPGWLDEHATCPSE